MVISGKIIVALYDWRKESKTYKRLNLFEMGELNSDGNQFLLLIPKNVLHGFCVVSKSDAIILNYPTTLYDKTEENRIPFSEVQAKDTNGELFSWQKVREEFKL